MSSANPKTESASESTDRDIASSVYCLSSTVADNSKVLDSPTFQLLTNLLSHVVTGAAKKSVDAKEYLDQSKKLKSSPFDIDGNYDPKTDAQVP